MLEFPRLPTHINIEPITFEYAEGSVQLSEGLMWRVDGAWYVSKIGAAPFSGAIHIPTTDPQAYKIVPIQGEADVE